MCISASAPACTSDCSAPACPAPLHAQHQPCISTCSAPALHLCMLSISPARLHTQHQPCTSDMLSTSPAPPHAHHQLYSSHMLSIFDLKHDIQKFHHRSNCMVILLRNQKTEGNPECFLPQIMLWFKKMFLQTILLTCS